MPVSSVQAVWHYTWGVLSLDTREHVYLGQTKRQGWEKNREGDSGRNAGYGNRDALGIENKGGCCLFLGPHNMRGRGHHFSSPPLSIPLFPTFLLGTCNRHSGLFWVSRIPIREAAGYWQADILLPSPVCRTETRQGLGIWQEHVHTSEYTTVRTDKKMIRVNWFMQVTLELRSNEDDEGQALLYLWLTSDCHLVET